MAQYDEAKQYSSDPFKRTNWPQNGFIDDFQAYTLGFETTNLIAFWTAVHGISATIKRQASLNFGDGLFPNFFILIVAPPAVVRKSTALGRFDSVENKMWDMNVNKSHEELHRNLILRGKATPEQLFDSMSNKSVKLSEDQEPIESDANLILRISELSVFLSKAQYNQTLIDRLTDFYDCKDNDTDSTVARGSKELHKIFCSMFGCTTPDAFRNSIPETAFGGGFMSRCTVVQERMTNRIIPIPYYPKEGPPKSEMADRLMWIQQNKRGTYTLTSEAYDTYCEWYREDIMKQRQSALEVNADHREGRKSVIVLKLALVFALQRYDLSKEVTSDDFKRALRIVEMTNETSLNLLEDITIDVQEDGKLYKFRRLIREAGSEGVARAELARKYHFKKQEIEQFIDELTEREELEVKRVKTGVTTSLGKDQKITKLFYIEKTR